MKLRWFRTATIECTCAGKHILIDPFFVRGDQPQNRALRNALARADLILITHPHLDHFSDIAQILKMCKAPVFVSAGGRRIAAKRCEDIHRIHALHAGMKIKPADNAEIRVWASRHVRFDRRLCTETLKRAFLPCNIRRGLQLERLNLIFRAKKEDIFGFEIIEDGRRVFVLGSANLCEGTAYPRGADCLVYPFQGRSDIMTYSAPIIKRLHPKRVLLTHYDDSFPPISAQVDTSGFCRNYPFAEAAEFNRVVSID